MAAGKYDITIEQGATFSRVLTWKDSIGNPINLTGWTARLQARTSVDATTSFINLTTGNGGIILGGTLGTITLTLTATQTAVITDNGKYDLELLDAAGNVTRLLEGKIKIKKEITR